jgi:hypothetical protein
VLSIAIAPALGRLAAPPGSGPDADLRIDLVDRLVVPGAAESGPGWVTAWRATAEALADRVFEEASADLRRAAIRSRYPAGHLAGLLPDDTARDVLVERLAAEAMELERMASFPADPATTRARGAALEAAWDAAVGVVRAERRRWLALAQEVDGWRRPWRPLAVVGSVLVVLALVAAAWIGGWLPAPAWFRPVVDAFWGLPWP